ncbi:unnamed protein product [Prorocentrum cordatum]|uniref:Apple domain-containing protein n=1 Tax=Prorocentrum cordatum TaxID=2364126 RepID=A0ABN9PMJ8_9DINO|nr:unnamed protein product [Polarella glacialis]
MAREDPPGRAPGELSGRAGRCASLPVCALGALGLAVVACSLPWADLPAAPGPLGRTVLREPPQAAAAAPAAAPPSEAGGAARGLRSAIEGLLRQQEALRGERRCAEADLLEGNISALVEELVRRGGERVGQVCGAGLLYSPEGGSVPLQHVAGQHAGQLPNDCRRACAEADGCACFTWTALRLDGAAGPVCNLYASCKNASASQGAMTISGHKSCTPPSAEALLCRGLHGPTARSRRPRNYTDEEVHEAAHAALRAVPSAFRGPSFKVASGALLLYILTSTGEGMLEKAGIMLAAIRKRVGSAAVEHAFVCERECASSADSSLGSFVELPDVLWNPPTCKRIHNDSGQPCSRYAISSIKFVYGIIHEALRLDAAGRAQPRWWLIKDDDTFVHVPNFLLAVAEGSRNDREWGTPGTPIWEQLIAAASLMPGCGGTPCGGGGFVLSGALGLELAKRWGARWLEKQLMAMERPQYFLRQAHSEGRVLGRGREVQGHAGARARGAGEPGVQDRAQGLPGVGGALLEPVLLQVRQIGAPSHVAPGENVGPTDAEGPGEAGRCRGSGGRRADEKILSWRRVFTWGEKRRYGGSRFTVRPRRSTERQAQ